MPFRITKICCLILLSVLTVCAFGQGFQQATGVVPPNVNLKDVSIIQRLGSQVPLNVPFRDQEGSTVTFGTMLHGKPAIVLAIFYQCAGVCSVETENLVIALEKMTDLKVGKDFDVVLLGIHPKETVDMAQTKLKETLASSPNFKGTSSGWHMLTGTLPNIRSVTSSLGFFYTYDESTDIINHPAGLMFLTSSGVVSSYILGANFTVEGIRKDLGIAKRNQIGIKSPDIFFGCIHIDPLTGRRSIVIENVLRVAGVLTIAAVGLTLLTLTGKTKWSKRNQDLLEEDPDEV